MNFIKSRMNRDNFWNLMFWLGMILSASLADLFRDFIPILSALFLILTVTLTPYLLAKANKVTYTEDKVFINKEGQALNNRYPKHLVIVLVLSVIVSIQLFFAFNQNFPSLKDSMFAYTGIALLCPILYFILKNCPISILFNKHAWCEGVTGLTKGSYDPVHTHSITHTTTSLKSFTSQNPITDSSYSGCSWNIHNSNYYNKR